MVIALMMGASPGLFNVVLGALDSTTILIKVAQIVLGMAGLSVTISIPVAKQLELDANNLHHEAALGYGELHRMIRNETILLRRNDSSYASAGDFLKQCQN